MSSNIYQTDEKMHSVSFVWNCIILNQLAYFPQVCEWHKSQSVNKNLRLEN